MYNSKSEGKQEKLAMNGPSQSLKGDDEDDDDDDDDDGITWLMRVIIDL